MSRISKTLENRTSRFKRRFLGEVKELRGELFLDLNRDTKNSILLVGMGRSGTTWISNVINYNNEFRYMFEPFHPLLVRDSKGFRLLQYLRPTNNERYFVDTARRILSGRLRSKRVDRFNRRFFYKKRLIKDISAPLFLKWINVNFPDVKIILLFRHPCAVAMSKLKLLNYKKGWDGVETPRHFLDQEELVDDFLGPFVKDLEKASSLFEHQIITWCILHYVLLHQFSDNQVHLAFYENFCQTPQQEISRLFSFIYKDTNNLFLDERLHQRLKRPSQTVQKGSAVLSGVNPVEKWREEITDIQMERAIHFLKMFELDKIYSSEAMPNVAEAYDLMKGQINQFDAALVTSSL